MVFNMKNKNLYIGIVLILFLSMSMSYAVTDKALTIIKDKNQYFLRNYTYYNIFDYQLLYSEIYKPTTFFTIQPASLPPYSSNVTGYIDCGVDTLNINYDPNIEQVYHIEDFMFNVSSVSNSSAGGKHYEWQCYFYPTGDYDWFFNYQITTYATLIDTSQLNNTFFDKMSNAYIMTFESFQNLFGYITNFIALIYLLFEFLVLTFVVFGLVPFMFYIGIKHIKKLKSQV